MFDVIKPFCKYHIATVENPTGTDCSAHLIEGHCFKCPYKSIEDVNNRKYPCQDAEPLNEVTGTV